MQREGTRPEVVRNNMGHANIAVTQNVYGKSWREERVGAVTEAVAYPHSPQRNQEGVIERKENNVESTNAACLRSSVWFVANPEVISSSDRGSTDKWASRNLDRRSASNHRHLSFNGDFTQDAVAD